MNTQNIKPAAPPAISQAELELGCINLISQLEIQVASAREAKGGHVENAAENTDRLLEVLFEFGEEFLNPERQKKACDAIQKASYASLAHKEVLNTRSWGFAIKNLLGKPACSDASVRQTYDNLGESLLAACVTVLQQAAASVGFESETGQMIEQSTAIFMEEFKTSW
jgi:hypothetical protein